MSHLPSFMIADVFPPHCFPARIRVESRPFSTLRPAATRPFQFQLVDLHGLTSTFCNMIYQSHATSCVCDCDKVAACP